MLLVVAAADVDVAGVVVVEVVVWHTHIVGWQG